MLRLGTRATPSRLVLMRTKYSTVFETEDASKRWTAVEDILPPIQIPTPNLNQPFPTPSGIYLFFTLTYPQFTLKCCRMATTATRKK